MRESAKTKRKRVTKEKKTFAPWYRHDSTPPSSLPSDIAARRCGHSSTAARQEGASPLSLPSNQTTRLFPSSVILLGFDGSSVERTEPTGYQFAAQSKLEGEEIGKEEEAAASAAEGESGVEEAAARAAREEVSWRGGRRGDGDDDVTTCRRRR